MTQTTSVGVTNGLVLAINSVSTCPGIPATFIMSGAYNYSVYAPQGFLGVTQTTFNVNPNAMMTYTIAGSAPGCVSGATTIASVVISPLPTITVNSAAVCSGGTATLAVYGGMNYAWSTADTGPVVLVSPSVTTVYTVTGSSDQNCLASAITTVVVNSNPVATLSLPNGTVCANAGVQTLTGTPQGGFFSGPALNADQFNPSAVSAGTYVITYKYTDTNGCAGIDSKTISVIPCVTVSLSDQLVADDLTVYPVPVKDALHVVVSSPADGQILEIINLQGSAIIRAHMQMRDTFIGLEGLVPGIYFIKITSNGSSRFLKFIKE